MSCASGAGAGAGGGGGGGDSHMEGTGMLVGKKRTNLGVAEAYADP